MVYEMIKKLVPVLMIKKLRLDSDFTIVSSFDDLQLYYFNSNTSYFFSQIDGRKTIEEIVEGLKKEFDVENEVLENDYVDFIRDLQWKKLIKLKELNHEEL